MWDVRTYYGLASYFFEISTSLRSLINGRFKPKKNWLLLVSPQQKLDWGYKRSSREKGYFGVCVVKGSNNCCNYWKTISIREVSQQESLLGVKSAAVFLPSVAAFITYLPSVAAILVSLHLSFPVVAINLWLNFSISGCLLPLYKNPQILSYTTPKYSKGNPKS